MSIFLEIAVRSIGGCIAIYAFAFFLVTPAAYRKCSAVAGLVGAMVYVIAEWKGAGAVVASFLSALAVALLSHGLARLLKAPVTIFLVAGILPTVPGAGMYQTVHYILEGNQQLTAYYLIQTLEIAGVIALAVFLVDTVFEILRKGDWKQNSMRYVRVIKGKKGNEKEVIR